MAVSPGLMLVPSSMVILKKAVVGYNNILKTATEDMKFGTNTKVNYVGVKRRIHLKSNINHADIPTNHLDTLDGKTESEDMNDSNINTLHENQQKTPVKTPDKCMIHTPKHTTYGVTTNSSDVGSKTGIYLAASSLVTFLDLKMII